MLIAHRFSGVAKVATILAFGSVIAPGVSSAATPGKLYGGLAGSVKDNGGVPQMGAIVQLFNRFDRPIERTLTNSAGEFSFQALLPDIYSIRITLSSFMPAFKRGIAVQAGSTSVLAINVASMLSSVEFVYSSPNSGALMSDDWKWVLRSSMATRPILRIFEEDRENGHALFSDTRGVIRLSSGEGTPFADSANQPDLGTTFALATSLFGRNQVQFAGNIGYAVESALPATGFRTSFGGDAGRPAVKLTMQQVSMPTRANGTVLGQGNAPALRTMSLTFIERTEILDGIDLEYGASLDSVTFIDRLNYMSPFARVTYHMGDNSQLQLAYSSGAPPVELIPAAASESDPELQRDMMALAVLPRVSLRNGQARVQRSQNMEVGYELHSGGRTYAVAAFHETVGNGAITMSTPENFFMEGELMPELSSSSSVFSLGTYSRFGYSATVTQQLGDRFSTAVSYGRGGVLTTGSNTTLENGDANELRGLIRQAQRNWVRGRVSGIIPGAGTRFSASYEWSGSQSLTAGHVYLTQRLYPETGLNVRLRQTLPAWGALPGRLEATAELRNMLAQGYLPISLADSRRLVLAHSPRAVRGGLSFIF